MYRLWLPFNIELILPLADNIVHRVLSELGGLGVQYGSLPIRARYISDASSHYASASWHEPLDQIEYSVKASTSQLDQTTLLRCAHQCCYQYSQTQALTDARLDPNQYSSIFGLGSMDLTSSDDHSDWQTLIVVIDLALYH